MPSERSEGSSGPPSSLRRQSTLSAIQARLAELRVSFHGAMPVRHVEAERFVQEGDIVLFKGRRAVDCLVRCCTRSEYNHVALGVRSPPPPHLDHAAEHSARGCAVVSQQQRLHIFEATTRGVICYPLDEYVEHQRQMRSRFEKVAVRRIYACDGAKRRRGLAGAQREVLCA